MPAYYINKNSQSTGEHEVHREGCSMMPEYNNRIYLGSFSNAINAVREARKILFMLMDVIIAQKKHINNNELRAS